MFSKIKIFFIFIIVCNFEASAQSMFQLSVIQTDSSEIKFLTRNKFQQKHKTKESLNEELFFIINKLHNSGYISASFDSVKYDSLQVKAFIYSGQQYVLLNNPFENIDENILRRNNLKTKNFAGKILQYNEIQKNIEKIVTYYENNGFPFAEVRAEEIFVDTNSVFLKLKVTENQFYRIDSIILKGEPIISKNYLEHYLNISTNDIYNESEIQKIENRLKNSEFLNEIRTADIEFSPTQAALFLYLEKKKANRFDGIAGIMTNNKTDSKIILTGNVNLLLFNSFKRGEKLQFNWERTESQSQRLVLNLGYPYFFKTALGIDYRFELQKNDSSFIRLQNLFNLQYFSGGNNYISAFYEKRSSFPLPSATSLSELATVKSQLWGFSFFSENLDNKYNPRKGYSISARLGLGKRLADTLQSENMWEAQLSGFLFYPMLSAFAIKFELQGKYLKTNTLYQNELYRFGGMKTLRGFNEDEFFASQFLIGIVELRYLFEEKSYFSLFYNLAYYEQPTSYNTVTDFPQGFGTGVSFFTNSGIFSVGYSLGKQFDNKIDMKSAKIYFGYVNTF